jgi:hypothetical protein
MPIAKRATWHLFDANKQVGFWVALRVALHALRKARGAGACCRG